MPVAQPPPSCSKILNHHQILPHRQVFHLRDKVSGLKLHVIHDLSSLQVQPLAWQFPQGPMDVPKLLFNPPTEHIYVYPTKWGKETHLANCLKGWDNVSCREDKLNGFGMIWGKDATKMQIYNMPLVKYGISSYYLPAPCFLSRSLDFNQFLLQPVGLTSTLIRP